MTVKQEIEPILTRGGRVSEDVNPQPEADIANLRAAVHELQTAVVRLSEHVDDLTAKLGG